MFDSALRPAKDRLLGPLARTGIARLPPIAISLVGLGLGLGAAVAAWRLAPALAVALWLGGRLADGLDGLVARARDRSTDLGGLLDFFVDAIAYVAVPLGLAFGLDDRTNWIATAVLLASFYLNAVTLGFVSALLEKRTVGAPADGRPTSTSLPRGLVEGTETIVLFTLALALPNAATTIWWIMAGAVLITAVERVVWAARTFR